MTQFDFDSKFWQNKAPLIDSRQLRNPAQSIFFALKGLLHNGHQYIDELYKKGVRNFVVCEQIDQIKYQDATFIICSNPLAELQSWSAQHRAKFRFPVLSIGGSNGKTIIKEWLYQLLHKDYFIVKSPKSFNSQIGVPLSVLQMQSLHEFAILEAGISQPNEMGKLEQIIKPDIGIFTNIGPAHDEGFRSREEKILEKLILFKDASILIYCSDYELLHQSVKKVFKGKKLAWGFGDSADIKVSILEKSSSSTKLKIIFSGEVLKINLPFVNAAALENALHCCMLMLDMNFGIVEIQNRMKELKQSVSMRLEWKAGLNKCMIIDDTYNNDLSGLRIALEFMDQKHEQSGPSSKTLILSDIRESGIKSDILYKTVADWLKDYSIDKFIAVGPDLMKAANHFNFLPKTQFYADTNALLDDIEDKLSFNKETILIKGARSFEFERIVRKLRKRTHNTVLELDLNALLHNFNIFKSRLNPETKIMVMVKAFAYGSSSYEIAKLLQYHQVDYLGVAYSDEGIELRKKGIKVPIMIMNAAVETFEELLKYDLQPTVYSFEYLNGIGEKMRMLGTRKKLKVHIELDSGMHRLGFAPEELDKVSETLNAFSDVIETVALFSHLAAADEPENDAFTAEQINIFKLFSTGLEQNIGKKLIKHILNSSGMSRFENSQFDMVRLGIGLHGIDPIGLLSTQLMPVATLRTVISQIRKVDRGTAIGYGRHSVRDRNSDIATLAIGYADGLIRAAGNGKATVLINGKICPLVGNICMDMCFADVTDIDAKEGDEVIVFGTEHPIELLSKSLNTIPYEILTHISGRVPRIFFES
jgi:Alr-MurF fusion protein